LVGFQQQAMADDFGQKAVLPEQRAANRAHGAAVQMMNFINHGQNFFKDFVLYN
jgi:hypothetical protein